MGGCIWQFVEEADGFINRIKRVKAQRYSEYVAFATALLSFLTLTIALFTQEISSGVTRHRTPRIPIPEDAKVLNILSWNVNGLRAVIAKSKHILFNLVQKHQPDVLCLQETKLQEIHVDSLRSLLPGYTSYWTCSTTKKVRWDIQIDFYPLISSHFYP